MDKKRSGTNQIEWKQKEIKSVLRGKEARAFFWAEPSVRWGEQAPTALMHFENPWSVQAVAIVGRFSPVCIHSFGDRQNGLCQRQTRQCDTAERQMHRFHRKSMRQCNGELKHSNHTPMEAFLSGRTGERRRKKRARTRDEKMNNRLFHFANKRNQAKR